MLYTRFVTEKSFNYVRGMLEHLPDFLSLALLWRSDHSIDFKGLTLNLRFTIYDLRILALLNFHLFIEIFFLMRIDTQRNDSFFDGIIDRRYGFDDIQHLFQCFVGKDATDRVLF